MMQIFSPSKSTRLAQVLALLGVVAVGCASPQTASNTAQTRPSPFLLAGHATAAGFSREPITSGRNSSSIAAGIGSTSVVVDPVLLDAATVSAAAPIAFRPDGPQADAPSSPDILLVGGQTALESSPQDAEPNAGNAPADPSSTATGFPVEHFVAVALASHPKIQAARQRVAAAVNRIPQERALADPMLSDTIWPFNGNALQTAAGRAANQLALTQQIPWPEKLSTKAAIASREVQVARAEVERIEREIAEAVKLACIEVAYASHALEIIDETAAVISDLTSVAEAQYRSGGSQQDVKRIQLEADRLADQRVQIIKQKMMATADLAALLHRPTETIEPVSQQAAKSHSVAELDELITLAEQCNPELKGLAWQVARDREKQRLACLQQYPDFQVGVNWMMITENDAVSRVADGNDNFGFTLGLMLPIWRDKIDAGIREASHRTAGTAQLLESERDAVYGKLRRLMAQADSLIEQQQIYTDRIIPRTEDTFKLTLADYRGKRSDFFTLIETYRELLMLELQLARIDATLAGTIAQIERVVGCSENR